MNDLCNSSCEVCRIGAPQVAAAEMDSLLEQIPDWQVSERQGVKTLQRVYSFKNFKEALAFTNKVGDAADHQGHHPEIIVEWGRVSVSWWTHKIGGLHENDFIMAAKTDALY